MRHVTCDAKLSSAQISFMFDLMFCLLQVNLRGATAVVTCQEKIVNNKKVQPGPQCGILARTRQICDCFMALRSILMATHVFRRGPSGKWQLMHRHASKPPGGKVSQLHVKVFRDRSKLLEGPCIHHIVFENRID